MLCKICQVNNAIEEDDICEFCFYEMSEDMAKVYSFQVSKPKKGRCCVCDLPVIYTTICPDCRLNIPF